MQTSEGDMSFDYLYQRLQKQEGLFIYLALICKRIRYSITRSRKCYL